MRLPVSSSPRLFSSQRRSPHFSLKQDIQASVLSQPISFDGKSARFLGVYNAIPCVFLAIETSSGKPENFYDWLFFFTKRLTNDR
jgi:hypothetical protein